LRYSRRPKASVKSSSLLDRDGETIVSQSIDDRGYRSRIVPLALIKRPPSSMPRGTKQYPLEQGPAAAVRLRDARGRGEEGATWSGKYVGINPRKIMGKLLSLVGPAGKAELMLLKTVLARVIRARNFAQFNFVNKLLRRISVGNKISKMAPGSMPNLRESSRPPPPPSYPLNEVINIIERTAPSRSDIAITTRVNHRAVNTRVCRSARGKGHEATDRERNGERSNGSFHPAMSQVENRGHPRPRETAMDIFGRIKRGEVLMADR